MAHLLPEGALYHFTRGVLVVLERFADACQQRACDEVIALDRNATAERTLQNIRDGDALARTGIEMLDKRHIDMSSQQGELSPAQLIESPALPAATRNNGFVPHSGHLF